MSISSVRNNRYWTLELGWELKPENNIIPSPSSPRYEPKFILNIDVSEETERVCQAMQPALLTNSI